ncbi:MAG: hypothetical protein KatS3mg015_1040 [Fimbriimonadales bacterium]|nr:MAG: hypothetical protein KatS3mg015_1040 [Fimbriimonadales bacterium]
MNKKLMALALAVCALAATTSLTPIIAKASSASRGTDDGVEFCRAHLSKIARRIALYRQDHDGKFPYTLDEVGIPPRCPIHKTRYWYMLGVEARDWLTLDPQSREAFRNAVKSLRWDGVPIVVCIAHFDPANVVDVQYYDQGDGLPPRPMGIPADGEDIRILGATLEGTTGYYPPENGNQQRVAEFAHTLLRERGE